MWRQGGLPNSRGWNRGVRGVCSVHPSTAPSLEELQKRSRAGWKRGPADGPSAGAFSQEERRALRFGCILSPRIFFCISFLSTILPPNDRGSTPAPTVTGISKLEPERDREKDSTGPELKSLAFIKKSRLKLKSIK